MNQLVSRALEQGVILFTENDQLKFKLTVQTFPEELRKEILQHKADLISYLSNIRSDSNALVGKIIPIAAPDVGYPVSFSQSRIWFIDQLFEQSPQYNMVGVLSVFGDLDLRRAVNSVRKILKRHKTLLSNFRSLDGVPVVSYLNETDFEFSQIMSENMADTKRIIDKLSLTSFDLSSDLLFETYLLEEKERRQKLIVFKTHHIVFDGVSLSLFLNEFKRLYCKQSADIVELPIQYHDYAAWQKQQLDIGAYDESLNYWVKLLSGTPTTHNLPLITNRAETPSASRACFRSRFTAFQQNQVQEIKNKFKLTDYMTLHAVIALVISRFQNSPDVVIGMPIANREHLETESLIGFFANTLALRVDTDKTLVSDYLSHIKERVIDAQKHQHVPLDLVIDRLNIPRSHQFTPLFQILLSVQTGTSGEIALEDAMLVPIKQNQFFSDYDLDIQISINEDHFDINWLYNDQIFDEKLINRIAEGVGLAISSIADESKDGSQLINQVNILTPHENKLINHFVGLPEEYVFEEAIHRAFESQVLENPAKIAVEGMGETLSYIQLNDKANRLAHYLRSLKLGQAEKVGLYMERTPDLLVSILAVFKAGYSYVPLDTQYPLKRIKYILKDAGVTLVITNVNVPKELGGEGVNWLCPKEPSIQRKIEKMKSSNLALKIEANDIAYLIYTSGSTGTPKGVLISHKNLSALLCWASTYFSQEQIEYVLASTSINFDLSVFELYTPLVNGTTCVLVDSILTLVDVPFDHVTLINTVPSGIKSLLDSGVVPKSLKTINLAGEPLKKELVNQIFEHRQGLTVCNLYGPSEDTTYSTEQSFQAALTSEPSIGRSIRYKQARIVNFDGSKTPFGVTGELVLSGDGLSQGYLNKKLLTDEKFVQLRVDERNVSVYRTGDFAKYLPNGELQYMGREDDQIKLRGYRIELAEIEQIILQEEFVLDVCVLLRGSGDEASIVAFVVIDVLDKKTILEQKMAVTLPSYMLPKTFVNLSELPKNNNGKIDKNALKQIPLPQSVHGKVTTLSELESTVAKVWAKHLSIEFGAISKNSNFFSLGGHSLLAVKVINELRKLRIDCNLQLLFKANSLQTFCLNISKNSVIQPVKRDNQAKTNTTYNFGDIEKTPITSNQYRMWFIDKMQGQSVEYNMPYLFELDSVINVQLLEQAFRKILKRHLSLRSVINFSDNAPYQTLLDEHEWSIGFVELSEERLEFYESEKKRLVSHQFKLAEEFPIKVDLIQGSNCEFRHLVVVIHHIAFDQWSADIMLSELFEIYQSMINDFPAQLTHLTTHYYEYANQQYQQERVVDEQVDYWVTKLTGAPACHSLPTRARSGVKQFPSREITQCFDNVSSGDFKTLASRLGITPFMLIHGLLTLVVSRFSYHEDILIGTPIANRNNHEHEKLIGLFANTLVLRADTRHETVAQYFEHIKTVHVEAQSNQSAPFEKIVELVVNDREASYTPLFQILLTVIEDSLVENSMGKLGIKPLNLTKSTSKFDIEVFLTFRHDTVLLNWHYDVSLFDDKQINEYKSSLSVLLHNLLGIAKAEQFNCKLFSLFGEPHYSTLLKPYTQVANNSIHHYFEKSCDTSPQSTCIEFNGEELSFKEVEILANKLAHYLSTKGIKARDIISLEIERSNWQVISILACLKLGAVYLPLDPLLPSARKSYIVEEANSSLLLGYSQNGDIDHTWYSENNIIDLAAIVKDSIWQNCNDRRVQFWQANPDFPAYLLYTSGSTGKPKGVLQTHQTICNLIDSSLIQVETAPLKSIQYTPYSFDVSIQELAMAWKSGSHLVVISQSQKDDLLEFSRLLVKKNIERLFVPPAALQIISEQLNRIDTAVSLKEVFVAGEQFNNSKALTKLLTTHESISVWNHYGPTETHVVTSALINNQLASNRFDIGFGIDNHDYYVLDKFGLMLPVGYPGQLFVTGKGVALGYIGHQGNNFFDKPNHFRGYLTGDVVVKKENEAFSYIDRLDNQINLNGYRIELSEVEQAIEEIGFVNKARVLLAKNNGRNELIAFIDKHQGAEQSGCIRTLAAKLLPQYMIPNKFITVDVWPLTKNGKIDNSELMNLSVDFKENSERLLESKQELLIGQIWADLLGVTVNDIYLDSNFFSLGGTSLLALRILDTLQQKYAIEFKLSRFYSNASLSNLVDLLKPLSANNEFKLSKADTNTDGTYYPLTVGQSSLFSLSELDGANASYNIQFIAVVNLPYHLGNIRKALELLFSKHAILRVNFQEHDNTLRQFINTKIGLTVKQHNVASQFDQESLSKIYLGDFEKEFDLTRDAMLRCSVISIGDSDSFQLMLTMPHIASDGRSMQIIIKEFIQNYIAFCEGSSDTNVADDVRPNYFDYAIWQEKYLRSELFSASVNFWREFLIDEQTIHGIQLDYKRPSSKQYKGKRICRSFEGKTKLAIDKFVKSKAISTFNFFHGVLALVVANYSYRNSVIIGVPIENRMVGGSEDIIGYFANTLPLKTDTSIKSVDHFYQQLVSNNALCFEHQHVPFQKIVDVLNPARSAAYTPIFQIVLNVNEIVEATEKLTDILMPVSSDLCNAKFDLDLAINVKSTSYELMWQYDTAIFSEQKIEDIAAYFDAMVGDLVHKQVSNIEGLGEDYSTNQLLRQQKAHYRTLNVKKNSLYDCLLSISKSQPNNIAVVTDQQVTSYGELIANANDIANALAAVTQAGDTLAIFLPRGKKLIEAIIACTQLGVVYVPVDIATPIERVNYILVNSQAKYVLVEPLSTHDDFLVPYIDVNELEEGSVENPIIRAVPDNHPAYIIYTSGTTGKPKGVVQSHYNVLRLIQVSDEYFDFSASDNWCLFHSISFDFSVWELWGSLLTGGTLTVPSFECTRDTHAFYHFCKNNEVTVLNQTPSAFRLLSQHMTSNHLSLPRLNYVIFGGEGISEGELDSWFAYYGEEATTLVNMYGITETCVHVTFKALIAKEKQITAGAPLRDQFIYCLSKQLKPVPRGAVGELFVAGAGLAIEYKGNKELTNERFFENPFASGEMIAEGQLKMYRTGDLGSFNIKGDLVHLGRNDHQIQINGHRVELGEIASVIEQVSDINQSIVLLIKLNQQDTLCHFYTSDVESLEDEDINRHLVEKLPFYMMPHHHIAIESLPLTTNHKIDLTSLEQIATNYLRHAINIKECPEIIDERTISLLNLFREQLQFDCTVSDNFFAVGGDSIKGVSLVKKANKYGFNFSLKDLYTYQNVNALMKKGVALSDPVVLNKRIKQEIEFEIFLNEDLNLNWSQYYPVSSMQNEMLRFLDTSQGVYHPQQFIEFNSPSFSLEKLQHVLNKLTERHVSLRTVFVEYDEKVHQVVLKEQKHNIVYLDYSSLTYDDTQTAVRLMFEHDLEYRFDILQSNWRFSIVRLTNHKHGFFVSCNHAVEDGWGMTELFNDIFRLYSAEEELNVEKAPNCVLELVQLEQRAEETKEMFETWQYLLASYQPLSTDIILSKERPQLLAIDLHESLVLQIKSYCKELGISVKSLFMVSYMDALSQLYKEPVITIDAITSKRTPELTEPLRSLGLFWTFCPIVGKRYSDGEINLKEISQNMLLADANSLYPRHAICNILGDKKQLPFAFKYVDFYNNAVGSNQKLSEIERTYSSDIFYHPIVLSVGVANNNKFDLVLETKLHKNNRVTSVQLARLIKEKLNAFVNQVAVEL